MQFSPHGPALSQRNQSWHPPSSGRNRQPILEGKANGLDTSYCTYGQDDSLSPRCRSWASTDHRKVLQAATEGTPTMTSTSWSTTSHRPRDGASGPLRAPWRSRAINVPRQGHHSRPKEDMMAATSSKAWKSFLLLGKGGKGHLLRK